MPKHTHIQGGIQRGPRLTANFTTLSNEVINDDRLSFRARGVLMHLLSKPADWRARSIAIAAQSPREGRDAIRTAMRELEELGYLVRERVQHPDGTFAIVHTINAVPAEQSAQPGPGNPEDDLSGADESGSTQRIDLPRIETKPTSPKAATPTQRVPKRVGVLMSAHAEGRFDALAAACRDKGLAARWDVLKPEQADVIAGLLETHGVDALAKAAVDAHRPSSPTKFAQGYIGTWSALPLPRRASSNDRRSNTCSCGDCDGYGFLPDEVNGRVVRCAAWATRTAVAA